ncbi:MAG: tetratricopeptide repeat protein [Bacteroidaceae bacterium]|nr:tetratricopeptide repeat protein [Bacteroidaceae bacterium]
MTARYNTLYNGRTAFDEGIEAQEKGHKDNYTEILPVYIVSSQKTSAMGKSNFDVAIEKSEKAIKKHSIKRKPKRPAGRMTPKQKEYFSRKEFNTSLRRAWLMLADAQFQKGEFIEAASTYNYILRLYAGQPDVTSQARAKLARCYVLLEWPYDAEDVFNKMRRDTITERGQRELDASKAAYYVATGQYREAVEPLKSMARHTAHKLQRARLYYLLGQLYAELGDKKNAYSALRKCVRMNPPYELAFNARIMQTEVMADGQGKTMIRKLRRMTKNPNNADYLDRIYYAIGNIYLASRDTTYTIYAWKKGIEESTQNGYAKAVVLQRLGELYWERENYIDATDCYNQLASLMDKENDDYQEVQRRSKILTEVEPHLSAVKLQDSLQALAKLPEKEYLAAIDRVIEELKKKEKEQEKREAAMEANGARSAAAAAQTARNNATTAAAGGRRGQQSGTFYFYNPQTVMQGKQDFQKKWGKRANEDNWRLNNKEGLASSDGSAATEEGLENPEDSTALDDMGFSGEEELSEEEQRLKDSLENDPHQREYYLKQIPFTPEQVEASDALILDGLYHGGVLEMEKIENFTLAEKTLNRVVQQFPWFEQMDDVYYHLFLLAMRRGDTIDTSRYLEVLRDSFPESKLTQTITNPRFLELSIYGKHLEDTLYAMTYDAYKEGNYWAVDQYFQQSSADFTEGAHRGKFLFVHAMSLLYSGQRDSFLVEMKQVAEKFSKDEIAELAGSIVKGVQEGRLLASEQWDASNIWANKSFLSTDSTEMGTDSLVVEVEQPHVFVLAYPTGELDEDQLLYEMARYNFTSFMARNFDIEFVKAGVISQLRVTGFQSYDEVHAYAQQLYSDQHMRERLEGIRAILISEQNLKLLGTRYSYDEYAEFYEAELSPLEVPEELILDEPDVDYPTDIDDVPEGEENGNTTNEDADEEGTEETEEAEEEEYEDDDWLP